jgi:four helix bundle protein
MKIERFEDLHCWQEARKLVNLVCRAIQESKDFQKDVRLCGQITAAAVSSMSNIAEGFSRRSNKEFIQYLFISKSSATEVQTCPPSLSLRRGGRGDLYVSLDQKYIAEETFHHIYEQAKRVSKLDSGLITYLLRNQKTSKQKETQETQQTQETRQTR